jgi:nicotinamidase-related amidase
MDLRTEWIEDDPPWVKNAARMLAHARASGWPIAHCYRIGGARPDARRGAISPACAPRPEEPVFSLIKFSALEEGAICDWLDAKRQCFILGAIVSRAGLATMVAAGEIGRPFTLLSDAIGASVDAGDETRAMAPAHLRAAAASVINVAGVLDAHENNIVALDARRRATMLRQGD